MNNKKISILIALLLVFSVTLSGCEKKSENKPVAPQSNEQTDSKKASDEQSKDNQENQKANETTKKDLKKIKIILDWTPNTNHTGLYCAKELGLFDKMGYEVSITQPPEGSTTQLIGAGGGELGISFQDTLAKNFVSKTPLPVTAVAAILQHNTSGIISLKEQGIDQPKKMTGKKYSTWDDPIEKALLKKMVNDDGGNFDKIELVPFGTDVISALKTNSDSAWVYYAWDGVATNVKGLETNFLYFKDYIKEADYYTPVIIANNKWLDSNPDDASALLSAISEGYNYAIANPEKAADFLLKNAPELDKELVYESQKWINTYYKDNDVEFGYIDPARWNKFYKWLFDNKLIEKEIPENFGFTNDYLPITN